MKNPLVLLALIPLCTAPVVAAAPLPATYAVQEASALRTRFDAAVEALRVKAEAKNATRADYQRVVDEWKAAAEAAGSVPATSVFLGERILERIAELERMAQAKMYEMLELDILKDQAIDAELEYILARLKSGISARQPTRIDWDSILANLTARADAAKAWNPAIDAIVPRLRAEIEALMAKAKAGPLVEKDFTTATDIATEIRVANVLTRLEKRGMEQKTMEADFADVADVAKRIPVPPADSAELVAKVNKNLDELRAAAKGGRITREQFAALRDLLMIRARAASSSK